MAPLQQRAGAVDKISGLVSGSEIDGNSHIIANHGAAVIKKKKREVGKNDCVEK